MKIGVVYPQTEFGSDPDAIREYTQTAEALGFSHVLAYDHVLGADPDRRGGWLGPYTYNSAFHEPFVLFSFMAGITRTLEFITGILILPQRETALVAKQSSTLDRLSGGRFRLGIGVGWNWVEYQALNQDFHKRGKRVEAQVDLLHRLWTERLVTVDDEWHSIPDAGIHPLPVQQPIPIWFGGHADVVLRRVARTGDGWLPNYRTVEDAQPSLDKLDQYLEKAGRTRNDIGLEPRLDYGDGNRQCWETTISQWQAAGATHLSFNTMSAGFASPADHIRAIKDFATLALG